VPDDEDAPSRLVRVMDLVDLEADRGSLKSCSQLGSPAVRNTTSPSSRAKFTGKTAGTAHIVTATRPSRAPASAGTSSKTPTRAGVRGLIPAVGRIGQTVGRPRSTAGRRSGGRHDTRLETRPSPRGQPPRTSDHTTP